jgi:lipopolysaccharide/colanic/teichoic acid biosynthesis glycosyltransferase
MYRSIGKRAIDVIVSGIALCLVLPLLAVIAIAVRWLMGSPVLFRQTRIGLGEQPFSTGEVPHDASTSIE